MTIKALFGTIGVQGFAIDSRQVKPGYVFAAVAGHTSNGEGYIEAALKNGAIAVIALPTAHVEGVLHIKSEMPRKLLAECVAEFYRQRPAHLVAVTGTNGKTSTVDMCRQLWTLFGIKAASIGTLGIMTGDTRIETGMTTPDVIAFHRSLADLAKNNVTAVAFEASSHALDQYRVDSAPVMAAGFTNLTRDHLDYHGTFENYFAAKARIIELIAAGGVLVINADAEYAEQLALQAQNYPVKIWTIGLKGTELKIINRIVLLQGQRLQFMFQGQSYDIVLPLVGAFQADNALMAAALVIASGADAKRVFQNLAFLKGVPGRLELATTTASGAAVYVDYAHSPDGLRAALMAIRPHTRGKLHLVFGCGGDRDPGKRPLMGTIAAELADYIYVTDDNPRSEVPATIRAAIMAAVPHATNIGDRLSAIATAIDQASGGDVVLIAGKGHESGQIVGATTLPFDDVSVARSLVRDHAA